VAVWQQPHGLGQALLPQLLVVDLLIHKMQRDWQLLGAVASPIPKTLRA
jgi:hypothetical protein